MKKEQTNKKTKKQKEYYFAKGGWSNDYCLEPCNVIGNGVRIGSVKCQECVNCIEHQKPDKYGEVNWIKCSRIKEATKV